MIFPAVKVKSSYKSFHSYCSPYKKMGISKMSARNDKFIRHISSAYFLKGIGTRILKG